MAGFLGIDCGSISLNLVLLREEAGNPICLYRRIRGRSLQALIEALDEIKATSRGDLRLASAMVTGSARDLFSRSLEIPAVNEITAHTTGVFRVNPEVRTVIEVGGQDSKFIKIETSCRGAHPTRLGIPHERSMCCRHRRVSG